MPFAGMTVPCSALLLLLTALLCAPPTCHGDGAPPTHNVTALLAAASSDFTDFSAALAAANLTGQIDGQPTITVLAVDNAAMARLRARQLPQDKLGRVLSLHVLLDYFGDAKLRAIKATPPTLAASLFQASGAASGGAGIVSIAPANGGGDGRRGVSFAAADAGGHVVFYEKSVSESPYDIAVLQVSDAMESPSAEGRALASPPPPPSPAPVAAPAPTPVVTPSPKNQTAPPPKPAVAPSPQSQTAPPPKPAAAPSPKNQTAPAPAPAPAPEADDQPPADETGEHQNDAGDTVAPWSVGVAVAAVVLLLW